MASRVTKDQTFKFWLPEDKWDARLARNPEEPLEEDIEQSDEVPQAKKRRRG
jgi:hypothetical protein